MIVGIGIDLVEIEKFEKAFGENDGRMLEQVFTEAERSACAGRADRMLALAARFAAKEACMKALGTGWSAGISFKQVEVLRENGSPPTLKLSGAAAARAEAIGARDFYVSLTHQPGIAAAVVILQRSAS